MAPLPRFRAEYAPAAHAKVLQLHGRRSYRRLACHLSTGSPGIMVIDCSMARRPHTRCANQCNVRCASTESSAAGETGNSSSSSSSSTGDFFHNRKEELETSKRYLASEPDGVYFLTGPRNCGKSKFLAQLAKDQDTLTLLVNCRSSDCSTPRSFAQSVLEAAVPVLTQDLDKPGLDQLFERLKEKWLAFIPRAELAADGKSKFVFELPALYKALQMDAEQAQPTTATTSVKIILMTLIDEWKARHPNSKLHPRIFIDEANLLMQWQSKPEFARDLRQLGAFFTYITKDTNLCHVVLATSEFMDIEKVPDVMGMPRMCWTDLALGNFSTEDDARGFLLWCLKRDRDVPEEYQSLTDQQWQEIYETVGANAGDLRLAKAAFTQQGFKWKEGLVSLLEDRRQCVQAFLARQYSFSSKQYADAAVYLIDNKGVVPRAQMQQFLGRFTPDEQRATGRALLTAMVQANAFCVRPKSDWALDLPADMFQDGKYVVTANNTLEYNCMLERETELRAIQEAYEAQQLDQKPAAGPGAAATRLHGRKGGR